MAWSGLWNGVYQENHALIGVPSVRRRVGRALRGMSSKFYNEIVRTFVTDDVGSAAAASHTRIAAQNPNDIGTSGGVRTVETVTDISRNLAAADETKLLADIDNDHTPTFPTEKSGNSGGGKLGF